MPFVSRFFGQLFFPLALILSVSCQTDIPPIEKGKSLEVRVEFNLERTLLPAHNELVTKSPTNDLYAVQVFTQSSPMSPKKSFGYGLYDDLTSISFMIDDQNIYFIEVTAVIDAKSILDAENNQYFEPFLLVNSLSLTEPIKAKITNKIIVDSETKFIDLKLSKAKVKEQNSGIVYDIPMLDRLYGVSENFTYDEIVGGTNVVIALKHCVFSLCPVIANPAINDGYLIVSLTNSAGQKSSQDLVVNLNGYNKQDFVYSLSNDLCKIDWLAPTLQKTTVNVTVKYCKTLTANGEPVSPITTIKTIENCELERLKRYNITVNSIDDGGSGTAGNISINTESLIFIDGGELGG